MEESKDKPVSSFSKVVQKKESRKVYAQKKDARNIWLGLGTFGIIGWSIVIPIVLGLLLGIWLDKHYPISYSWTLTLLFLALTVGCINAWHWITKENKQIQKDLNHQKNDSQNQNKEL
jgi:ATP synthase protein I